MNELSLEHFERWLKDYGLAWEAKDAESFSTLFHDEALYYWTPFEDPQKGKAEIRGAFDKAVATQTEIEFGARVLYVEARLGAAHWSVAYTRETTGKRVHCDGIFVVQFSDNGRALSFREWWHSDEQ